MLARLPKNKDPNLLVGYETSDDAGIYRLTPEIAVITTADIITPPVDDPYLFGQIASANALSDVYAMGGTPLTCLNLISFPSKKLSLSDLDQIVAGGLSKITEAGALLAGGHTIEDREPKYGLAVTGTVHPEKFWRNAGARPGDVLILTKPIGSGVIFNANLENRVSGDALEECLTILTTLNRKSADVFKNFEIHAVTDVTGFGLAGHALEMAEASKVHLTITMEDLPVMKDALEMYHKGVSTGVNRANRQRVQPHTHFESKLPHRHLEIVFDPQTSGGLLAAVPEAQGASLLQKLKEAGIDHARMIGRVQAYRSSLYLTFI
jgi:selenide,water dikinase